MVSEAVKRLGRLVLSRVGFLDSYLHLRAAYSQFRFEVELDWRHRSSRKKALTILQSMDHVNLELGGGDRKRPGWVNIDLFALNADLQLDLRRSLPFPDQSVDRIYSEHVLEHFEYPVPLRKLLSECFRILRVGGELLAAVPDFGRAFRTYSLADEEAFYKQQFWSSPEPNWCRSPMDQLNWLVYMGGQHRFMFDEENIAIRFLEAGFGRVEPREFDPSIDSIERRHQSIYVRAVKETIHPLYPTIHEGLKANTPDAYDALWSTEAARKLYGDSSRRGLWRILAEIAAVSADLLLDIGCGGGDFLALLADRHGWKMEHLYGMDYSLLAIEEASRRVPGARLIHGDVQHIDFPEGYFGTIVACEVLEHVADPARVLNECFRVLRPRGRLIVSIPNGDVDDWEGHAHRWNSEQFRKLLYAYEFVFEKGLEGDRTLVFVFEKPEGFKIE